MTGHLPALLSSVFASIFVSDRVGTIQTSGSCCRRDPVPSSMQNFTAMSRSTGRINAHSAPGNLTAQAATGRESIGGGRRWVRAWRSCPTPRPRPGDALDQRHRAGAGTLTDRQRDGRSSKNAARRRHGRCRFQERQFLESHRSSLRTRYRAYYAGLELQGHGSAVLPINGCSSGIRSARQAIAFQRLETALEGGLIGA